MTQDTEQEVKQFTAWWANDMNNADSPRAKVAKATAWLAWQAARATPPEVRGSAGDVQALRDAARKLVRAVMDNDPFGRVAHLALALHAALQTKPPEDRAPAEARRPQDDEAFDAEDQDGP